MPRRDHTHKDTNHLYTPCPSVTTQFSNAELVDTCDSCGQFYAKCCFDIDITCHHSRVVYTDGACSRNGKPDAVAGIGIAFGTWTANDEGEDHQFSFQVDDELDPGSKRTNQRAELLAALVGLKKICDHEQEALEEDFVDREHDDPPPGIIITTDSEYVVKGMTELLPKWKKHGMKNQNGNIPGNLDLFLEIEAEVEKRERTHNCRVMFWHVRREYNTIADKLARKATVEATKNDGIEKVTHAVRSLVL